MISESVKQAVAKLTYNGAANLVGTLEHPNERFPDLLNGDRRLFTGLGKYTTLSAMGVTNHLKKLGLIEDRYLPWNGPDNGPIKNGWESPCLTELGRDVAEYAKANWDRIDFREGGKR
ncbi:hypothetical protein G6L37_07120 [Agrobacterium rubi]|nr:hypothetical protein [Agrobacterium rubi]NTF25137.1 hypothetical protein [Agrobacterium rubi]